MMVSNLYRQILIIKIELYELNAIEIFMVFFLFLVINSQQKILKAIGMMEEDNSRIS